MRTLARILTAAWMAFTVSQDVLADERVSITHAEALSNLELRSKGENSRAAARFESRSMSFDALGRRFELDLEPNTGLLSPEALAALPERLAVYRGSVRGMERSWARITVTEDVPAGMFYDGRELYGIELREGEDRPSVFRLADVRIDEGSMSCAAAPQGPASGAAMYDAIVGELSTALQNGPGAVEEIEIGALGDEEFNTIRLDPVQSIVTRMNNVDGIYTSEFGIQVTVPVSAIEIFDTSNDPFSDTTNASDLLDEVAAYRRNSTLQSNQGLTHLFTGRDLDGTTVGIAFLGVLCSTNFGAALTQADSGTTIDSLIAAHEIGHNFGADHDGDPDGSCPAANDSIYVMAPRVAGGDTFSSCSTNVILAEAAQAACIVPLPTVDVRVTSFNQPETVLLGRGLTLNFDVENRGSLQATNVAVQIDLPNNVTLQSAATSAANCTSGAGTVTCNIGTLVGGSTQTITLSTSTDSPGVASFIAAVTADNDDNTSNNTDVHNVTIRSAIDLVANPPSSLQVTVNQSGNATVEIENTTSVDATGVTATVTVDAGLGADAASWTAGSCTVTGATIDCSANSIAGLSTSTLTITLTGVDAGTRGYTVQLAANEVDADASSDTVSGTVNVQAPRSNNNGGGGGGGAPGWLLLGTLCCIAIGRRRRS